MIGDKHTPGPWEIIRFEAGTAAVQSDESYICTAYMSSNGKAKANAHLIAAAPELLAALKAIMNEFDGTTAYSKNAPQSIAAIAAIAKAIAKAEGRTDG